MHCPASQQWHHHEHFAPALSCYPMPLDLLFALFAKAGTSAAGHHDGDPRLGRIPSPAT